MQLKPEQFLALHPVFSRADLISLMSKRNIKVNPSTVNSHIDRWVRQGRILQVKRGVYVHAPEGTKGRVVFDKFALASKLAPDSLLSHHTALELHGIAQSTFRRVTYLTLSSVKALTFHEIPFTPIRPRPHLRKSVYQTQWVDHSVRDNAEIQYTSIERTLVDVLDRPDLAGGIDEVWRSCASIGGLRFKELEEYLVLLGSSGLIARVGFYLEQRMKELAVPAGLLSRLEKKGPRSKVYFLRADKGPRRLISRWNLIVPNTLIDDSFEGL